MTRFNELTAGPNITVSVPLGLASFYPGNGSECSKAFARTFNSYLILSFFSINGKAES